MLCVDTSDEYLIDETDHSEYRGRFRGQNAARFFTKLGLPPDAAVELVQECLDLLAFQEVDFTLFFRHVTRVAGGGDSQSLAAMFSNSERFEKWFAKWREEANPAKHLADMRSANPVLIPR